MIFIEYSYIFVQNSFKTNFYKIIFKCHVRIEIDNSELGVICDFTTISALESLRLRLRDPNIANRCKIAYNPSLVVVYFYSSQFRSAHAVTGGIVSGSKFERCRK